MEDAFPDNFDPRFNGGNCGLYFSVYFVTLPVRGATVFMVMVSMRSHGATQAGFSRLRQISIATRRCEKS